MVATPFQPTAAVNHWAGEHVSSPLNGRPNGAQAKVRRYGCHMALPDMRKTPRRPSRLLEGFDSLTLDPSPRLRRLRMEMSRPPEAGLESAWKTVGEAMAEAVRSLGRTFGL